MILRLLCFSLRLFPVIAFSGRDPDFLDDPVPMARLPGMAT